MTHQYYGKIAANKVNKNSGYETAQSEFMCGRSRKVFRKHNCNNANYVIIVCLFSYGHFYVN